MSSIADANAFSDPARVLSQHQAALTLLQHRVSAPGARVEWLDLACGKGQIIASIDRVLSEECRSKIAYHAHDLNSEYARETERVAHGRGFKSFKSHVSELENFHRIIPESTAFDFITLINVTHELEPICLPGIFLNAIKRLSENGILYLYDLEQITPPELGAIPWRNVEIKQILNSMLSALGEEEYKPEVPCWPHSTCTAWGVVIDRTHIGLNNKELTDRSEAALEAGGTTIKKLLENKLRDCRSVLDSLAKYGSQTSGEAQDKERLLHELYAVPRALEEYP